MTLIESDIIELKPGVVGRGEVFINERGEPFFTPFRFYETDRGLVQIQDFTERVWSRAMEPVQFNDLGAGI